MFNNKNKYCILTCILLLLLACIFVFSDASVTALGTKQPDNIVMTWTEDPETTLTITWRTDVSVSDGQVQYVEYDENGRNNMFSNAATAAATTEDFYTNIGQMKLHSVTIRGLKPGTKYAYRVGTGTNFSEPSTFLTAPQMRNAAFCFLVFGDSQSYDYAVWGKTINNAFIANPNARFFVNVGDLVDRGQDYKEWNAWFAAAKGVLNKITIMPVVGNHETYVPNRKPSLPTYFTTQFKLPQNGPDGLKGQVYSFDYGEVHFAVLDSQMNEEQSFITDMYALQERWLINDLQTTDKKWKMVFLHRPIYNNSGEGGGSVKNTLANIFEQYKVDIVFTAHEHVYARTHPMFRGIGLAADANKQGVTYVPTGRSGTKYYKKGSAMWWNTFFYNPVDEPNYIVVSVAEDLLNIAAFKQSGVKIDEWNKN